MKYEFWDVNKHGVMSYVRRFFGKKRTPSDKKIFVQVGDSMMRESKMLSELKKGDVFNQSSGLDGESNRWIKCTSDAYVRVYDTKGEYPEWVVNGYSLYQ